MWYLLQGSIIVGVTWWVCEAQFGGHPQNGEGRYAGYIGVLVALLLTGYINAAVDWYRRWRAARQALEQYQRAEQRKLDF
jgi:hypothetical protein